MVGQEEAAEAEGRLGGDAVFHRENAQNTISAENHLEMPHLLSQIITVIKVSRNASRTKASGWRMSCRFLMVLLCGLW